MKIIYLYKLKTSNFCLFWLCFCNYKIHFIVAMNKKSRAAICGRYLWNVLRYEWHAVVHRGGVGLKNEVVGARCLGDVWQTRGRCHSSKLVLGLEQQARRRGWGLELKGEGRIAVKSTKPGICCVSFRDSVQIWHGALKCCDICMIYFTWNYLNIGRLSGTELPRFQAVRMSFFSAAWNLLQCYDVPWIQNYCTFTNTNFYYALFGWIEAV